MGSVFAGQCLFLFSSEKDVHNKEHIAQPIKLASQKVKRSMNVHVRERFIEVALVADRLMLEQYRRENLESYLFSLMNLVC